MASGIYERFKANLMNKEVDLEADQIKVMLMDNVHVFDATDDVVGDVNANDIGNKAVDVAGGSNLAGGAVTQAATTKWDGTDHSYGAAETLTAYFAVLWDDTVGTDDLVCCIDFGGAQTCTNGTFTIQWHANGIITLT